jgi:uncharacterized membrane protein
MLATVVLDTSGDVKDVLLWAAAAGLVGAIVGELITTRGRSGDWGGLEPPRWRDSKRWYDLGSIAAIPIGILAGILAGLLIAPEKDVLVRGVTRTSMELEALLGTALLAGLAGTAFLRVLQERFVAVARTQRLRGSMAAAVSALDVATPTIPSSVVERVKDATTGPTASSVVEEIAATSAQPAETARKVLVEALSAS